MGSLHVRLFFVLYALGLGYFVLGQFDPATTAGLASLGLRSAFGVLIWLLAGMTIAYIYLFRRQAELRRTYRGSSGFGVQRITTNERGHHISERAVPVIADEERPARTAFSSQRPN